jgi:hypothetical protein
LIATTPLFDHAARVRSLEILMAARESLASAEATANSIPDAIPAK